MAYGFGLYCINGEHETELEALPDLIFSLHQSVYIMYACTYILYVTIRHSIRENTYIEMNASPGKILIPNSR